MGQRLGGRAKGTPNKRSGELRDRLKKWACDPFHVLAIIANGEVPCGVCRGKGKSKFQPRRRAMLQDQALDIVEDAQPGERTCQSCWGSGKERINPADRAKAAAELCQYIEAKRKAVEVTGPDGGAVPLALRVVFVDAEKGSDDDQERQ